MMAWVSELVSTASVGGGAVVVVVRGAVVVVVDGAVEVVVLTTALVDVLDGASVSDQRRLVGGDAYRPRPGWRRPFHRSASRRRRCRQPGRLVEPQAADRRRVP
jgi:hypothetical protein